MPHNLCHGCVTVSQIQDPALILGVDGAQMVLDEAHDTNTLPNLWGGMLGTDWSCQEGKKSRFDVNLLSSGTCNTIFVDCLVQDAYGNVAVRQGRLLASPQDMYINRIRRR